MVDSKLLARLETAVQGLSGKDGEHGRQFYLALGKRIVEKGADYVGKVRRWPAWKCVACVQGSSFPGTPTPPPGKEISRLTDLIESPGVKPESRTGFQMKQNVLKAFVKAR